MSRSAKIKISERIRKLLRLSKSDNVAEAANAAAQAQRLMEKHQLDVAMLSADVHDGGEPWKVREHHDKPLAKGKRIPLWKVTLAQGLAGLNGCKIYMLQWEGDSTSVNEMCLIGTDSDVGGVHAMFKYLAKEIGALARVYRAKTKGKRKHLNVAVDSFRRGAVDRCVQRLRAEQERVRDEERAAARALAGDSTTALARVESAIALLDARLLAARACLDALGPEPSADRGYSQDWDAYERGRKAADSIDLNASEQRSQIKA